MMLIISKLITAGLFVFSNQAVAETPVTSLKEIRQSGVIIQQWDISCAAAALATVLTYGFSDPVSEEQVARAMLRKTEPLKVRHRGGFSLLDMRNFLEDRGYRSYGMAGLDIEDIRYLNKPIVPVKLQGFNHFVVFDGLDGNGDVLLADPAWGKRTLSRERFEAAWLSGIALVTGGSNP